jgi:hypothetical protein
MRLSELAHTDYMLRHWSTLIRKETEAEKIFNELADMSDPKTAN